MAIGAHSHVFFFNEHSGCPHMTRHTVGQSSDGSARGVDARHRVVGSASLVVGSDGTSARGVDARNRVVTWERGYTDACGARTLVNWRRTSTPASAQENREERLVQRFTEFEHRFSVQTI